MLCHLKDESVVAAEVVAVAAVAAVGIIGGSQKGLSAKTVTVGCYQI